MSKRIPSIERFWNKVRKTDGCWYWQGTKQKDSAYGHFWYHRKYVRPHRFAYEILVGPIPHGLTIDHLCRNALCVNPAHLEAVTLKENILRGDSPSARNAKKTHCPQNHAYSAENTHVWKNHRFCKMCAKLNARRYRAAIKSCA